MNRNYLPIGTQAAAGRGTRAALSDRLCAAVTIFLLVFLAASYPTPAIGAEEGMPAPEAVQGRDAPLWDKTEPGQEQQMPPVVKVSEGVYRLGKIRIDKHDRSVSVDGWVNMDDGLVEYLACGMRGKLYESLLAIDSEPWLMMVAMLLVDFEPGDVPLAYQGASGVPQGDPVEILVKWKTESGEVTARAEDLIFDKAREATMPHTHWVFTGSVIRDGRFMAQVEHSIVATYHDPYALFDHPLPEGNNDTVYFANKQIIPKKGTPIVFIIRAPKPGPSGEGKQS